MTVPRAVMSGLRVTDSPMPRPPVDTGGAIRVRRRNCPLVYLWVA